MQTKYYISKDCRVLDFGELEFRKAIDPDYEQQLMTRQSYVLKRKGKLYLINATIKAFLDCFDHGADLARVTQTLADKAKCSEHAIEAAVKAFFTQMCALKIIVPQQQNEGIIPIEKQSATIAAGTVLGGLHFEQKIFTNSKIEIYKAYSPDRKDYVAVKMLRQSTKEKNTLKSFAQEFFLLDELGAHPHICQFIELVQNEIQTYGVIEFIDGLPGRKYIKKEQPDLKIKLRLLGQFYDAMAFIHRKGFLHGDLHLSNLLIDNNAVLKIIDFNMSNRIKPVPNELIREGGVHQYIAPEKVDSRAFKIVKGPATFASEVFQMGVISYFFLYEQMPFEGFVWQDLAACIRDFHPPFPDRTPHGEKIPPFVIESLKKMLCKDAQQRYPNANILFGKWQKYKRVAKSSPSPILQKH